MKKLLYFFILCSALIGIPTSHAATLTFDDITTEDLLPIPDGYGGFNWSEGYGKIWIANKNHLPNSGYDHGTISGIYTAYNGYGDTPSIIDVAGPGTFDINGAYWTSAWYDQNLSFEGWNDGVQLYSSGTYAINTATPLWITLNWTGIDRLVIHSTNEQWVMDNFTYNETSHAVPVPAAFWLFGSALIGLAHIALRKAG